MTRLFAMALLALSLLVIAVDSAQAGRRRGCCCSPSAPAAPAAKAPEAPPAPPAGTSAQADRQTVRSYSYEPDSYTGSYRSYRGSGTLDYNAGRKILGR